MKTPTARKLPSGSWHCRVRVNGEDVSITAETEKAALAEAMAVKAGIRQSRKDSPLTVRECMDRYIEARAVRSPSTVRGYRSDQKNRFQSIMDRPVCRLTDADFQRAVNAEYKIITRRGTAVSPKTVQNAWCTIASAIREATGRTVPVNLEEVVPKEHPFLEPDQIHLFLDGMRGKPVEAGALLALHGLRRSEILKLTWGDIDWRNRVIRVRGASVLNEEGKLVDKQTNKSAAGRRDVPVMIPRLLKLAEANAARSTERVYTHSKEYLYTVTNQVCGSLGLPLVGVHGLRHSFASLAYHLGLPEKYTAAVGGWDDYATMHKIYTHLANADSKKYAAQMGAFFKNGNENGNE